MLSLISIGPVPQPFIMSFPIFIFIFYRFVAVYSLDVSRRIRFLPRKIMNALIEKYAFAFRLGAVPPSRLDNTFTERATALIVFSMD